MRFLLGAGEESSCEAFGGVLWCGFGGGEEEEGGRVGFDWLLNFAVGDDF